MTFHNSLWQSPLWESYQQALGNRTERIDGILVIERKMTGGRFWECPRVEMAKLPESFWEHLEERARRSRVLFTRVFPGDHKGLPVKTWPRQISQRGVPEIFPNHTLVIDLQQTEEEILKQMKPKGRYNISLASRKGVEIVRSDDVPAFYRLLNVTTLRDGFRPHPEETYRQMLESLGDNALLLLAKYQGEAIAGAIFVFCGDVATYYYGASGNLHRELMAPYLLQWEAIREAKQRGFLWYDFLGIAPEGAAENHRLAGVSRFKEKFGGIRIQYASPFEIVYHTGKYHFRKFIKNIFDKIRS